jgi:hypothetical protein
MTNSTQNNETVPDTYSKLVALEAAMKRLHQAYRLEAARFLQKWFPRKARQYFCDQSRWAKSLSPGQIATFNHELNQLIHEAPFLVSNYLWGTEFLESSEKALVQLRRACGHLDSVFRKLEYPVELGQHTEVFLGELNESAEMRQIREQFLLLKQEHARSLETGRVLQNSYTC